VLVDVVAVDGPPKKLECAQRDSQPDENYRRKPKIKPFIRTTIKQKYVRKTNNVGNRV
jgi:hypothetical protein